MHHEKQYFKTTKIANLFPKKMSARGDQFEFVITNFFSENYSKNPLKQNATSKTWKNCLGYIEQISKTDPEACLFLQEYYMECYCNYLMDMFKSYWQEVETCITHYQRTTSNENGVHREVFRHTQRLHELVKDWMSNIFIEVLFRTPLDNSLPYKTKVEFQTKLRTHLFNAFKVHMPTIFSNAMLNTFAFTFKVFDSVMSDTSTYEEVENKCSRCHFEFVESQECYCDTVRLGFLSFRNILLELGIFYELCVDMIRTVIYTSIEKYIHDLCQETKFDVSCLDMSLNWFGKVIFDWIKLLYLVRAEYGQDMIEEVKKFNNDINDTNDTDQEECEEYKYSTCMNCNVTCTVFEMTHFEKCSFRSTSTREFIINTYTYCRMKQLFDIILDYPTSNAALMDLHECIKLEPTYRKIFIRSLKNAFKSRLLHAGVATSDILHAYTTAYKSLKLLDPQEVILHVVCEPVRNYLRKREDTVRCIINLYMTFDNLKNSDIKVCSGEKLYEHDDEHILNTWTNWVPDLGVDYRLVKEVNTDVISMLINIFDTKEIFVHEYQSILAQKLITIGDLEETTEFRNIELLSLRFGDSEFHNCEVMLKDIRNSRTLIKRFNTGEFEYEPLFETIGLVLSEQFWPNNYFNSVEMKNIKYPAFVQEEFDQYQKYFELVKNNRTLNWKAHLGVVELELEFENGQVKQFTVKPILAIIICQFEKKSSWNISELATEIGIVPSVLRRHLYYWKNHGIIKDGLEMDVYELDEHNAGVPKADESTSAEVDADMEEEAKTTTAKNDSQPQICWTFVENMLRNLHSLPLDRIFSMLKMFNIQSSEIDKLTLLQLRQFLDSKVSEQKLIYSNGLYELNPDAN